jgi:hypothetical protein
MLSPASASRIAGTPVGVESARGFVNGDAIHHSDFGIRYTTEHFTEMLILAEQPFRPAPSGTSYKALPK